MTVSATSASVSASEPASVADLNAEIQRFVQLLTADVSGPPLELPSYPVVALRAQRVLMDPLAGAEQVTAVIGCEPVLTARIVMLANTAALSRSGKRVTDLRAAVGRLGFDVLRAAAIGFAIAQLRNAPAYRDIAEPVRQLCESSVAIAALGYVLARRRDDVSPETAMLGGLVSGMGRLYLLTRMPRFPALMADPWTREEMFQHWHAQVARRILESWYFAPELIDAVAEIDRAPTDPRGRGALADVIACGRMLQEAGESAERLAAAIDKNLAARRLGLTVEACTALLADSAHERAQLRHVLTG
jgi:HD-like signal output (HDOD) protein